jgi:hypothetical protein
MHRSEPILTTVLALLLGLAAHRADAEPAPQRYSAPITIAENAPFVRVSLPPSTYAHALQTDLRDVRVVDARGERVPFAFLAPPAAPQASEQLREATLYPLPPRPSQGGTWPSPVDVTVEGDRISVRRSGLRAAQPSAFPGASPGWLIDIGETRVGEASPYRLQLAWSGPAEFSVGYALETSDDLRTWRSARGGQVMALHSASGSLSQPFVPLPGAGRFLRLVWLDTASVPTLTGATAHAPAVGVVAADAANELAFAASAEPAARAGLDAASHRALHFDLGGDLPLRDVDLRFAGGTRVVPARVQGRSRVDEPWHELGAGVFYRLERDGAVTESPALATPTHARFVRVVPDERAGALDGASAQLVVHAPLASLVFATTGSPPFRLLAGSADAGEGALPAATLVPHLEQERQRFGRAEIGSFSEEPEVARAAERAKRVASLRPWLLWSVLLVGVAALAGLVWRLARTGVAAETPKP